MTGGRAVPEEPALQTGSERALWAALRSQLRPDEILLSGVRFTDQRNGDVEADFVILMPSLGAAVIEVKGGQVTLDEGQWKTSNGRASRIIHPVEQARRAKHALRRFLDRQPEWHFPLLRTEWLLALPLTDVEGDLGPEARRDLVIGRDDLPRAMDMVRAAVAAPMNRDPVPQGDWTETALSLLLRNVDDGSGGLSPVRSDRRTWALGLLITANIVLAGLASWILGPIGLAAAAVVGVAVSGLLWWNYTQKAAAARGILVGVVCSIIGLALGALVAAIPLEAPPGAGSCSADYSPCIPQADDLNCSSIGQRVQVVGTDVYDLDRDGDGWACESYPDAVQR